MKIRFALPLCAAFLLLTLPARADVESWNQLEMRLPLSPPTDFFPDSLRVIASSRFAGRHGGLGQSNLRVGPLWHLGSHLTLGLHLSAYANKGTSGLFEQELRAEIEPNVRWHLGEFHFNDRNRLEWRQFSDRGVWRYRNQLRAVWQPEHWPVWPMASEEVHFHLNGEGFVQNRVGLGFIVPLNDSTRLNVEYLWRSRNGSAGWDFDHIANLVLYFAPDLKAIADAPLESGT